MKKVQIDGTVFDLVADVKKQFGVEGGYTYTIKLNENKNTKASPAKEGLNASLNQPDNALVHTINVPQNKLGVNTELKSTRMSPETKAALEDYKAQQDAVNKARKALYDAERKQLEQHYKKKLSDLERSTSAEIEDIQRAFFSAVEQYEAKTLEAGAKTEQVEELSQALQEELDSHDIDKKMWEEEFSRLQKEYDKLKGRTDNRIESLKQKVSDQRAAAKAKVESSKKVEARYRIQRTVNTLNRMLLNPTRDVHVPDSMQQSVTLAMQAINGAMMSSKAAENAKRLSGYYQELAALQAKFQDPNISIERSNRLLTQIKGIEEKISNLNQRDANMKNALGKLRDQYAQLADVDDAVYDSEVDDLIQNAYEAIGDTAYSDLSVAQLDTIHDAYTAVLSRIRKANKAFREGATQRIDEMYHEYSREMKSKAKRDKLTTQNRNAIAQFLWNNLKPVYAFDRIGSKVMSELYDGLRKGEDTWYRDVAGAQAFFLGTAAQHGYDTWDFDRLYEFEASTGEKFELNLEEVMSLYAYSLRPQARDHLTKGGIVLNENTERTVVNKLGVKQNMIYNDANAYSLTDEMIDRIAGNLTAEQRAFARVMQQYLSDVMGAKGNEVSLQLYDIKLFKEQYYWPLKSSGKYSERAKASQNNPTNKVKNGGFTKALTPHASNPVELSGFMQTWTDHVNKMSMYHAFTLPMEDFYRVYNHRSGYSGDVMSESAQSLMEQACGAGAVKYVDQFLQDLNGGVRADPRETVGKALMSKFKKRKWK